jgi:3-deoxy-D-manno-octulosonate 8-phosphate phosphatase (KDO 8-P phosphatase)
VDDIRCLVLDVDGVLTDGRIYYGDAGPLRAFDVQDGLAVTWFRKFLGPVAVITGLESEAVRKRGADLRIEHVVQGSRDKLADLRRLLPALGVSIEQVAAIGDDLPDAALLRVCGFPIAPANAVPEVRRVARLVTSRSGGRGAVREAVEFLLRRAGRWADVLAHYGER